MRFTITFVQVDDPYQVIKIGLIIYVAIGVSLWMILTHLGTRTVRRDTPLSAGILYLTGTRSTPENIISMLYSAFFWPVSIGAMLLHKIFFRTL